MWKGGGILKKIMTATVEEEFLHFLLTIAVKISSHCEIEKEGPGSGTRTGSGTGSGTGSETVCGDDVKSSLDFSIKLLHQLYGLDRFQTVFQLTLYGNNKLKSSLLKTVNLCLSAIDNENKKLLNSSVILLDNNFTSTSTESTKEREKEKRKIISTLEKMKDSISKILILLA